MAVLLPKTPRRLPDAKTPRKITNSIKPRFLWAAATKTSPAVACETITCLPFGDAQTISGTCGDPSPMHFTGKERDSESGLDNFGARYNSSQYGRFMTPDPKMIMKQKLFDPQQWNMYSYARNNPLRFMDPSGKYNTDCASKDIKQCSSNVQAYDASVRNQLNSKDADVRAAAKAVGAFNDGNNVNVKFDPNAKDAGKTVQDTDANGKPTSSVTVTSQYVDQF